MSCDCQCTVSLPRFLSIPRVGLQYAIEVFPYHRHLFLYIFVKSLLYQEVQKMKRKNNRLLNGVAPITQLRARVVKMVTFKGGHLMW